ncbi:hypothetical protein AHAT_14550 [Agarivorans sp. Toyoura001]|nr:hypothetical protein AHAT_14550 [Agarivorans sp. Toyoura001]
MIYSLGNREATAAYGAFSQLTSQTPIEYIGGNKISLTKLRDKRMVGVRFALAFIKHF